MEPSLKSPAVAAFLETLFGRTSAIEQGVCVGCRYPVTEESFWDDKSRREYRISGLCQICQDEVFGVWK